MNLLSFFTSLHVYFYLIFEIATLLSQKVSSYNLQAELRVEILIQILSSFPKLYD